MVATDKPQVQMQSIFVECALLHDFLLFIIYLATALPLQNLQL